MDVDVVVVGAGVAGLAAAAPGLKALAGGSAKDLKGETEERRSNRVRTLFLELSVANSEAPCLPGGTEFTPRGLHSSHAFLPHAMS